MPKALPVFVHSVSMIFADFGASLRATSQGLAVAAIALVIIAFMLSGSPANTTDPSGVWRLLAMNCVMLVGLAIMIAAWHRYVLLPEEERGDGFTPSIGIVLGYLGRSILLALVVSLVSVPFFLIAASAIGGGGSSIMLELVTLPLNIALGWLLLRWSLILPACAIGRKLSVRDSWNATEPLSGTIFGLTVLLAGLGLAMNLILKALLPLNVAGEVIGIAASLLFALVSASVLTTLYGIAIEGRSID